MSVMAEEENKNQALISTFSSFQSGLPPAPAKAAPAPPTVRIASATANAISATTLKLSSILFEEMTVPDGRFSL